MSNGWNHAEGLAEQHGGSGTGLFVRLTGHGDKIVGAFVGDPFAREVHWGGERYEACTGDGCAHCEDGKKPSLRVALNFYVPKERDMKIIEGGVIWLKTVLKCRDKYGLETNIFEIERHGEAGDSKTRYSILPDERISDEMRREIDNARVHDLAQMISGGKDRFDSYDNGGGSTVNGRLASELMPRLKALPRAVLNAFLDEFGIEKVRDLKASDQKAAYALLAELESSNQEQEDTSIDPFA
jgi:hypothetical protein